MGYSTWYDTTHLVWFKLSSKIFLLTVSMRYFFCAQELDVDDFSLLVYPLRSRGKDGHFPAAQIVSGWITPLLFRLQSRAYTI